MVKKKARPRASIVNKSDSDKTVEIKIDLGNKDVESESENIDLFEKNENEENNKNKNKSTPKKIEKIVLEPVGFPIQIEGTPDVSQIKIIDNDLFQAYASDQWLGLNVAVGEYLFDQMIIPDFAFRIIDIQPPDAQKISLYTDFVVKVKNKDVPKLETVRFTDIIGNKTAIKKAKIIGAYLKEPEKFGEWAPKNILFWGPPGTGKTLTAKAIATEFNVPMLARKGTSLIGLHVGDGAQKIHSLYNEAREKSPCIIFIDEIDAIGLSRSFQSVRGDVVEIATALLAEMDGLDANKGIVTIGATNSIDLLDPGLRSRFEEEIEFPLPNKSERIELIKLFEKKIPFKTEINYELIASKCNGWSGRDIKEKLL
ncbi:MAG: AAA family ATPase, partial [Promethearchaeota archaeon]